jgi:hypothetical protein
MVGVHPPQLRQVVHEVPHAAPPPLQRRLRRVDENRRGKVAVVLDDLDELLQTTRAKIVTSRTALRTALLSSAARCALRAAS